MLRFLIYAILAYIAWKVVRLVMAVKTQGGRHREPPVDLPQDHSFKNIEDADFEDVTGDSNKPS